MKTCTAQLVDEKCPKHENGVHTCSMVAGHSAPDHLCACWKTWPTGRLSDPADKGADQFTPVNRRAGYGDLDSPRFQRVVKAAKVGGTLLAGEGRMLLDYHRQTLEHFRVLAQDLDLSPRQFERVLAFLRVRTL